MIVSILPRVRLWSADASTKRWPFVWTTRKEGSTVSSTSLSSCDGLCPLYPGSGYHFPVIDIYMESDLSTSHGRVSREFPFKDEGVPSRNGSRSGSRNHRSEQATHHRKSDIGNEVLFQGLIDVCLRWATRIEIKRPQLIARASVLAIRYACKYVSFFISATLFFIHTDIHA